MVRDTIDSIALQKIVDGLTDVATGDIAAITAAIPSYTATTSQLKLRYAKSYLAAK